MPTAPKFPYTVVSGAFESFLEKLKTTGVPEVVDAKYLAQVGYNSSNHRAFVPVMKQIGLLDQQGRPTERYRRGLRGGQAGRELVADGIREGYEALFATYPDANVRPSSDISTFISAHSDLGGRALNAAVSTFQTVCKFGDFTISTPKPGTDREDSPAADQSAEQQGMERVTVQRRDSSPSTGAVTINVNIALSVDATSDASVYDAFFAAMAKHLMQLGTDDDSKPA